MDNKRSKLLNKLPKTINPATVQFIGSGNQGEVYRLNQNKCIKIYKKSKYFHRELANLQRGKFHPLFPKVYEWGHYYIIREYVDGISLSSYFEDGNPLTTDLTLKLVSLWEGLKVLGFKRLDIRLCHIYLLDNGNLKIIDPTNLMNHSRSFPRKLLAELDKYGVMNTFLGMVKEIQPEVYSQWMKKVAI